MAGNYLAVTARFNPLSYEEIISPLAQATQAQQDIESQYSQLGQASDIWTNALDKTVNPIAAQRVEDYKNQLQQAAQELSTKGLTPQSRQSLAQMKNQYASDIAPIEQAYTKGQELSKELRLQREQNPTLLTNITPQTLSVDYLMQHPDVTPEYYSGALLTNQVASAVKAYANQIRQEGRMRNIAGGQYLERIDKYGLDPADVQAAMQGRGPKFLQDIVQNAIATSPISKWENAQNILPQAYQYAASGLSAGIGEDKIFREANRGFETEGQRLENQIKRLQLRALTAPPQGPSTLAFEQAGDTVAAQNSSKVKALNSEAAFIAQIKKNPNLLKSTTTQNKAYTAQDIWKLGQGKIQSGELLPGGRKSGMALIREGMPASQVYKQSKAKAQPMVTVSPQYQKWQQMVTKYKTTDSNKMLAQINREIARSSSINKKTFIKTLDNSNLNTFLLGQITATPGLADQIRTREGKKVSQEYLKTIFNGAGRIGYDAELGQVQIMNPYTKEGVFNIPKDALRNIAVPVYGPKSKAGEAPVRIANGADYIKYMQQMYNVAPDDPYILTLNNSLYNALDAYANSFKQTAPARSAKAIIP